MSKLHHITLVLVCGLLLIGCDEPFKPPPPTPTPYPPAQLLTFPLSGAGDHRQEKIDYAAIPPNVIPPVGGPHAPYWLNCTVYNEPVANENAVHSLEHGAVWITYQPDLPADVVATLKQITLQQPYVLLSPYPGIPTPIIASAWGGGGKTGFQLRLYPGQYEDLNKFIQTHANGADAPEHGAACSRGDKLSISYLHLSPIARNRERGWGRG